MCSSDLLEYPYARLFVNYTLIDPKGVQLQKKMLGNNLFDQKTGEPFGQSGIGDLFDHQFPLLKQYRFYNTGVYKLTFQQFMRKDTLEGVLAAGARQRLRELVGWAISKKTQKQIFYRWLINDTGKLEDENTDHVRFVVRPCPPAFVFQVLLFWPSILSLFWPFLLA